MEERDRTDRLHEVINQALQRLGLELFEVKTSYTGAELKMSVLADRPEGGVTVQECEEAAREIEMLMHVNGTMQQPHTLEVSSPGIDRPLKRQRDFLRNRGRHVKVVYSEAAQEKPAGSRTLRGIIEHCDETVVTVRREHGEEESIPLDWIRDAHIEVSFT